MTRLLTLTLARLTQIVALFLGAVILITVGVDFLLSTETIQSFFPGVRWYPLIESGEYMMLALGALCLVLPPVYLIMGYLDARVQRGIIGKGANGKDICLDSEAVSRTVAREIRGEVEEVVTVKSCETWQAFGAPRVIVRVVISDRTPVPAVQDKVRDVVVRTLTQLIGYADANRVQIKVREIAGAAAPRKRSRRQRAEESSETNAQELVKTP